MLELRLYRMTGLERDARALSSGTVSYLVDCTRYTVVDAIQADFVDFCAEMAAHFENWQQAWEAFKKVYNVPAKVSALTGGMQ